MMPDAVSPTIVLTFVQLDSLGPETRAPYCLDLEEELTTFLTSLCRLFRASASSICMPRSGETSLQELVVS